MMVSFSVFPHIFIYVPVLFRCFGCFTMDVIASVAFATQVDSQNNPDDPFVRHAQMFFSFSFFRPIMLFFSQSNLFVLFVVYVYELLHLRNLYRNAMRAKDLSFDEA